MSLLGTFETRNMKFSVAFAERPAGLLFRRLLAGGAAGAAYVLLCGIN
jgi:hypothetical protein